MTLPRFAVFKSSYNNNYLTYVNEDVAARGFPRFTGEEVVSPYAKFAVEMAKGGNNEEQLVHIRSCYNNKYLVRRDESSAYIKAGAEELEEDKSKWSCTLFEPVYLDDAKTTVVRFRHVQLGHYACLWRSGDEFDSCLYADSASPNSDLCDVCTVIDWESLLILPKRVAFKADNGQYLSAGSRTNIECKSSDIGDPTVPFEVFTTRDGSIRIKSDYMGKFWMRFPTGDWIAPISDDTSSDNADADTLFWPIKVNNNTIALRNLGNNNFCKRVEEIFNFVYANVSTISKEARLEVEELVMSRSIYNVNYHLDDARIYNQSILTMDSQDVTNSSEEDDTLEVTLTYTESTSKTWTGSVSLSLGISTTIQTGIPFIAEGEIDLSVEVTGEYQWGQTEEKTTEISTVLQVVVPPMTRVKVSLLATKGTCDVPFSYSQRDTFTNGDQRISGLADGVYTGINCFNFKYDTTEEKL